MAIWDDLTSNISTNFNLSGISFVITFLAFLTLIAILSIVIGYVILMYKRYNVKVTIFENIAGQGYVPTFRDKAMLVKIGASGEEILKLRKKKLFRTAYGKKIGKRHYAFAIGSDGYWYNFTFGDLDKALGELEISPVDRDMRYAYEAIRRNVEYNFGEKKSLLVQYLPFFAITFLMITFGIGLWFATRELTNTAQVLNTAMSTAKEVLDATKQILVAQDNILSGSGVTPALLFLFRRKKSL